ncbi:MAG: Lrp/AsnC family transcriptional regulator [Phycisphaerae bacterium]|nr:Lrp/AsnC family transcriptional regulator [Phycisphaerae bacterium]
MTINRQPDKTDWRIINILSEQYVSNSAIARELELSEGAIRQRIKKLQNDGILKIRALRDPEILKNQQLGIITANVTESSLMKDKAAEICGLNGVLSVSIISGRYDLWIEVLVSSNKGLITFLTEELSKIKGISKTETFLTLKSYQKYV